MNEIILYEASSRYFKEYIGGKPNLPLAKWKGEQANLVADRYKLNQEYLLLKEEVRELELVRRNAYDIIRWEWREHKLKTRAASHNGAWEAKPKDREYKRRLRLGRRMSGGVKK